MDIWDSQQDYEHFLRTHREAYEEMDARSGHWTTRERHVGCFDADAPS
jgi:hypothetical protein